MALERLTNERWGFETNCFVCEPRNDHGLQIPFFHDTEAGIVVARPTFDARHSGAPNLVHGGVQLAVMDEIIAWAAIAIGGRFAVTARLEASFRRPVRIGYEYLIEGRIDEQDEQDEKTLQGSARIVDHKDRACAHRIRFARRALRSARGRCRCHVGRGDARVRPRMTRSTGWARRSSRRR